MHDLKGLPMRFRQTEVRLYAGGFESDSPDMRQVNGVDIGQRWTRKGTDL